MRDNAFKLMLLAASMTLLPPSSASAAGLGRLTVLSTLGQPLNAEVELIAVQKNETISARLASQEVYSQANAQYNNALTGTRVTVEKRPNGQLYLKATTPRPVTEPFVELLIEINSENGRTLRQYTALLDPPGYGRAASELPPPLPPVVSTAPQTKPAPFAAPYDPTSVAATPVPAPAAPRAAAASSAPAKPVAAPAAAGAKQYGPIKPGETLGRIAKTVKPEGVSLEQTLVALHRQNPDAFIKKNMNLVRSGKILTVPEANEIAATPQRQAVQEVRLQVSDWNAYRGRVADRVASAPEGGGVTSGRIGSRVADPGAAETRDTVRLSRGEGKGKGKGAGGDRVRALEEEAIARDRQLAEANARISQLEQIIKDTQRAVELKGAPPAVAQKGADKAAADKSAKAPAPVPVPAPAAKAPEPPAMTADKAAPPAVAPAPAPPAVTAEAPKPPGAAPPAPEAKPVAKAKKAPEPVPAPEFDLIGTVMEEPLYLAAGGAVIGLGVLGFMMARRRRGTTGTRDLGPDTVKIAPSLGGAGGGAAPGAGSPPRSNATSPAARPSEPVQAAPTPTPRAVPAPSPVPAARARTPGEDNDLDFDVGMRRGAAEAAAAAPPQDMTPRAPGGGAARRVSEAPRTAEPPPRPAPTPAPRIEPALRAPEPPRAAEPPPRTPAPRAPDHAARATEVLRAAQAQKRPGEANTDPMMPDFALDASGVVSTSPGPTPAPAKDSNLIDFDLEPLPPVGTPLNMDKVASEPPPKVDFKLDLADLDLNAPGARAGAAPAKDGHWYDVQQKFDLAKAYEEMGDKDGARDILQEVLREGDTDQKSQAQKLLGNLS